MIEIKSPKDIKLMRAACRLSAAALQEAGKWVKPGITTAQIDKVVEDFITSRGARPSFKGYGGFPASACISLNDTVIHGIPSKNIVLQEGDIVSVDVGAYLNGFHGDNAYTFACGKVSDTAQHLMKATKESLYKAIEAVKPGNRIGDVAYATQKHVEANGFSVVRQFVGHGVGKALHEDPEVPNFGVAGRGARLVPGMTIAIEPMVNEGGYETKQLSDGWTIKTVDKGLSAHFEHTVLVTDSGYEILTLADGEADGT